MPAKKRNTTAKSMPVTGKTVKAVAGAKKFVPKVAQKKQVPAKTVAAKKR